MSDRRALRALWLVAFVATAAMWRHPTWLAGGYDWRYFESAMESARRSVVWFGELPLYNRYMCGGEPQLANPQSIAGSPAFLLVVAFGTAVGERLMMLLFIGLGLTGTYRLARLLDLDLLRALVVSLAFGLSGWFAQHFAIGHVSFFGATLIPYAIFFYLRGKTDLRYAIGLGAMMALIVAQGGTSTAAMAAIALAAVAFTDAIVERRTTPLVVLALGAGAALLLGAYRLLPALEFAVDHPRRVTESDGQSPLLLVRSAVLWAQGKLPGYRYAFHEYGWHVAYVCWPLAVVGLWRRGPLRRMAIALIIVGGAIAMGQWLPYGPWWLMRKLPVLRDLRVPSRYVLLTALGVCLLAGAGLELALAHARKHARAIAMLVIAAVAIEGTLHMSFYLSHAFDLPPPPVNRSGEFFQTKGHWSRMLDLVFENRGDVGCDEEAPLTRAKTIDEGPVAQARLADPSAGTLTTRAYTPNRIELDVDLARPARVLINLNWNEHWHASVGDVVRDGEKWPADKDGGRLAVALPAMRGAVVLRYRPASFVLGLWLTIVSALMSVWVCRRGARSSGMI